MQHNLVGISGLSQEKKNHIFYPNKIFNYILPADTSIKKQLQESLPFNVLIDPISPLCFPIVMNRGPNSNSWGQIIYHFRFNQNHFWFLNCKMLNDLVKNLDSNYNLVLAKLNIDHRCLDAVSQVIVFKPLK